jgi:predicted nucleic acid-binding protein
MRTAIDTNVISALWSGEPLAAKIAGDLAHAQSQGGLVICGAVYAELMAHPSATPNFVDSFLSETKVSVEFESDEALWRMAAAAFAFYAQRRRRSAGGAPKRLLVDFLVAAHASLRADRLMTLDAERYERDFPKLRIV